MPDLLHAPIGAAVFDAHDGMPEWLRDWKPNMVFMTGKLAHWILMRILNDKLPENKIVYKISEDNDRMNLLCVYDHLGYFYNLEL